MHLKRSWTCPDFFHPGLGSDFLKIATWIGLNKKISPFILRILNHFESCSKDNSQM